MPFHNVWNFAETTLAQPMGQHDTDFYVAPGTGSDLPPLPFIITITVDYTLNRLKQSERIEVTEVEGGNADHFINVVRNYDNPLVPPGDTSSPGTEARPHIVGEKCAILACAAHFEELQTAVEYLQSQPYPVDIEGDTLTLVNHLQVGDLKGGFVAAAGMIRWDGTNFQGYDGANWVNLDEAGSSGWTPPSANAGEIMYYNGVEWLSTDRVLIGLVDTKIENTRFMGDDVIIPNRLEAEDIETNSFRGVYLEADIVNAKTLFARDISTIIPEGIPGVITGYDISGAMIGSPGGFIAATVGFDPGDPTANLSFLSLIGEPIALFSSSSVSISAVTSLAIATPIINMLVGDYVFDGSIFTSKNPIVFTPTASVPATPTNGYMYYDSGIGFRVYQAGAWHTITDGAPGSLPPGGTEYGTIRYNPDTPDWEYTDELLLRPEGAYFAHALVVGTRDPDMPDTAGMIEYRNGDIMGFVPDPDGDLIEVSLTNLSTGQRLPHGVDTGIVASDYPVSTTIINLTGLTVEVTNGEYISFAGDLTGGLQNFYKIVSHAPITGPTQQIEITPGLVNAVEAGTLCNAKYYRTLYYGTDGAWHSTQYVRVVPNEESVGEDLLRAQSIQIGPYGQNGFEGTIKWDDTLKELQWHDGTGWNSWPVSASTPPAIAPEGSVMSVESAGGGIYNWVLRDFFRVLPSGIESDVQITTPVLVLDDGVGNVKTLTPTLFELGDFDVENGTIQVLRCQGTGSIAYIDTLIVGTLYTSDPEEEEGEPASMAGPRLDLRVNGVTDRDIFSFIADAHDLTFARNISLTGSITGPLPVGTTILPVTGFIAEVVDGYTIKVEGDANVYKIASHVGNPTTQITLESPGLYEEAADGAIVSTASPDSTLETIMIVDANSVSWQMLNVFNETQFAKHAVFDYTLQVGDEEPGIDEAPGMIRYNGDFQGRLDNGQWASFTLGLAGGEISGQGYGTILYWDGTKWSKNTNLRVTANGTLLLAEDVASTAVEGAIRYNGSDFQGYNGAIWVSLTGSSGAPSLPSGVGYPNSTLRWDEGAVDWQVNPNVQSENSRLIVPLLQVGDYSEFTEQGRIAKVGGYAIGATVLEVDTFYGPVVDGSTILIEGDVTPHTIQSHLPVVGPTTQITIEVGGLTAIVADNALVTVQGALVRPNAEGGQLRYNQNDYEGFVEGIGWVSFTGHVNYLPTREGDPLLDTGQLLYFNGAQWLAQHNVRFFRNSLKVNMDFEVQGTPYFYEPMCAESIKLGDKMPETQVNTAGSTGEVASEGATLPIGTTEIPVDYWNGIIYVDSQIKFAGDPTWYDVVALDPEVGDPDKIYIPEPGILAPVSDLTPISVRGIVAVALPAAGTIYYNSTAQKFYGYNGDVWLLLGSPIQGNPTENQLLRYKAPYWVPAAELDGSSLVEIQDTQLYSRIPLRLDYDTVDGWFLEPQFVVQGDDLHVHAFLLRGLGADPIIPEHPVWGGTNIWLEFCTGTETPAESGPYCKINTSRVILQAIEGDSVTVSGAGIFGGEIQVSGLGRFFAGISVREGDVSIKEGDLLVRGGDADIYGGAFSGFVHSHSYGYFNTYARVGYVAGADAPIGAIRYSTPGNVAVGDWEGWDGERWVSFTAGFHGQTIWGSPSDNDMLFFDPDTDGGRWMPLTSVSASQDRITFHEEVVFDSNSYAATTGAIRFTGVDFEACLNGADWVSLTSAAPGMVDGTAFGATLAWVAVTDGAALDTGDVLNGPYLAGSRTVDILGNPFGVGNGIVFDSHATVYVITGQEILGVNQYRYTIEPWLQEDVADLEDVESFAIIGSWGPTSQVTVNSRTVKINGVLELEEYEDIPVSNRPDAVSGQVRYNLNDYEGFVDGVGWISFTGMKHWADPADHAGEFLYSNGTGWIASGDYIKIDGGVNIYDDMIVLGQIMAESLVLTPGSAPTATEGTLYYDSAINAFKYRDDTQWRSLAVFDSIFDGASDTQVVARTSTGTLVDLPGITFLEAALTPFPLGAMKIDTPWVHDVLNLYNDDLFPGGSNKTYWQFKPQANGDLELVANNIVSGPQTWIDFIIDPLTPLLWFKVPVTIDTLSITTELNLGFSSLTMAGTLSVTGESDFNGAVEFHDDASFLTGTTLTFDVGSSLQVNGSANFQGITIIDTMCAKEMAYWGFANVGNAYDEFGEREVGQVRYTGAIAGQVDGAHSAGADNVNLKNYPAAIANGVTITFKGNPTRYTVTGSSGSPATNVEFTPDLTTDLPDEADIIVWANGDWEGWDGTYWRSFTNITPTSFIAGDAVEGCMIRYNGTLSRWEITNGLNIAEDLSHRTLPAMTILNDSIKINTFSAPDDIIGLELGDFTATAGTSSVRGLKIGNLDAYGAAAAIGIDLVGDLTGLVTYGIALTGEHTALTSHGIYIDSEFNGGSGSYNAYGIYLNPTFTGTFGVKQAIHVANGDVEFEDDCIVGNNILLTGVLKIDNIQVIKEQQPAIPDQGPLNITGGPKADTTSVQAAVNALISKTNTIITLLEAHGLIATA